MKELTWTMLIAFLGVLASIVFMFNATTDAALRERLVGFLELLVGFVIGAGTVGAGGYLLGYAKGKSS